MCIRYITWDEKAYIATAKSNGSSEIGIAITDDGNF